MTATKATREQAIELADALEKPPRFHRIDDAIALLRQWPDQSERIAALEKENANLRTVMIAAAETIHEHWEAHCDAEGYGPANLMHRLEKGIPAEYGYTAGAFEEQRKRIAALGRDNKQLQHDLSEQLHQVKAYDARVQELEAAAREARNALGLAAQELAGMPAWGSAGVAFDVAQAALAALDKVLGEKT